MSDENGRPRLRILLNSLIIFGIVFVIIYIFKPLTLINEGRFQLTESLIVYKTYATSDSSEIITFRDDGTANFSKTIGDTTYNQLVVYSISEGVISVSSKINYQYLSNKQLWNLNNNYFLNLTEIY
jgi:hypothetical protein